ncbi:hypothetical protein [Halobaculum rarum]|uniref:hypothetical protein n=1 Tax=Halobaculum rarum TaxID=3075122 RepID=UPI0032AE9247
MTVIEPTESAVGAGRSCPERLERADERERVARLAGRQCVFDGGVLHGRDRAFRVVLAVHRSRTVGSSATCDITSEVVPSKFMSGACAVDGNMSGEAVERSVGAIHADEASLASAAAAVGGVHVALLADRSVDGWHRAVEAAGPSSSGRSYLISVEETVRGGAVSPSPGSAGQPIAGGVAIGTVEAPLSDPIQYLETVLSDLGDDPGAGGTVVVDDVGALVPSDADVESIISGLVEAAAASGLEFHTSTATNDDDAVLSALSRRVPADDDAERALTERLIAHLRRSDPTNFGYLRTHWREARRGLTAVEMSYPQSKQIHASIHDPETTPRTLGATLQALVTLGALDVWGDTVAANRYDLTRYDPTRVDTIGSLLTKPDD